MAGLPLDLWIEDVRLLDGLYPHNELERRLKFDHPRSVPIFSGAIIQDDKNALNLSVDPVELMSGDVILIPSVEKWLQLIERYNLEKIIGNFLTETQKTAETENSWRTGVIIDQDLLSEIRENRHIQDKARKHRMTPTQLRQFRKRVIEARDSGRQILCAEIAESIASN